MLNNSAAQYKHYTIFIQTHHYTKELLRYKYLLFYHLPFYQ